MKKFSFIGTFLITCLIVFTAYYGSLSALVICFPLIVFYILDLTLDAFSENISDITNKLYIKTCLAILRAGYCFSTALFAAFLCRFDYYPHSFICLFLALFLGTISCSLVFVSGARIRLLTKMDEYVLNSTKELARLQLIKTQLERRS
jgi:hypothetical protein